MLTCATLITHHIPKGAWQRMTGGKISAEASAVQGGGVGATIAANGAPAAKVSKSSHGAATVASLSAAALRKAAKRPEASPGKEVKMKTLKKAKESKLKKGFKNTGTQTLQSSKSTQTDITLAMMNELGLPDVLFSVTPAAAFPNGREGGSSRGNSSLPANTSSSSSSARPVVVLQTPRGAFSSRVDAVQRPDHQGLSLDGATYPGDLELPNVLEDIDPVVNQYFNDVRNCEDDDDDDGGSDGLRIDPLAQSWGGFPTNWKDQKGSFESLF